MEEAQLKLSAKFLVGLAVLMFFIPVINQDWCQPFDLQEYATFVGGTAAPLGSLAGFIFVYVSYLEAMEQNRRQNQQFLLQFFDQSLNRLIEYHEDLSFQIFFRQGLYSKDGLFHAVTKLKRPLARIGGTKEDIKLAEIAYRRHFFGKFRYVIKWIKSLTAILAHIHNNQHLGIADDREMRILNLMSKEEMRVLFYFFFINDPELSTKEKAILKRFLIRIPPDRLFNVVHVKWLNFV